MGELVAAREDQGRNPTGGPCASSADWAPLPNNGPQNGRSARPGDPGVRGTPRLAGSERPVVPVADHETVVLAVEAHHRGIGHVTCHTRPAPEPACAQRGQLAADECVRGRVIAGADRAGGPGPLKRRRCSRVRAASRWPGATPRRRNAPPVHAMAGQGAARPRTRWPHGRCGPATSSRCPDSA
jgi:hypothetical protein